MFALRQYGFLHKELTVLGPRRFDTPPKVSFSRFSELLRQVNLAEFDGAPDPTAVDSSDDDEMDMQRPTDPPVAAATIAPAHVATSVAGPRPVQFVFASTSTTTSSESSFSKSSSVSSARTSFSASSPESDTSSTVPLFVTIEFSNHVLLVMLSVPM